MNKSNSHMRSVAGSLLIVFLSAALTFAGTEETKSVDNSKETPPPPIQKNGCVTPAPYEFRFGIPGWISALQGDFGVKGVVAPLDVSFTEILQKLDAVPVVLSVYARYQRWEFFADGEYIQLHDGVQLPGLLFSNANVGIKFAFWEGFVGYRVINCEQGSLSIYAGARYNYYSGNIHIFDNGDPRFPILREALGIPDNLRVNGSIDWIDPVVGLGGRVRIWKPISFWAKGDVGGFGVASDVTWQVQGGLEAQVSRWFWAQLGWRYMKYDYTNGGFTNKTDLNGPFVQGGVNF